MISDEQMEGYKHILPHAGSIRDRVTFLLKYHGPMSDHTLYAKYIETYNPPITPTLFRTVGARRYELVKAGKVQKLGTMINSDTGVHNTIWGWKPWKD